MQVATTVGHAEHSGDLRRFIEQGKKIIVTTVQKFPWVLDEIGAVGDKRFAIMFVENESFRRFVGDMVYRLTRQGPPVPGNSASA